MKMLLLALTAAHQWHSIKRVGPDRPFAISRNVCAVRKYHSSIWIIQGDCGNACNAWRGGSNMGFFERLFGRKNSADSAKERLQLVLIHDRTDLTPAELDSLKDDLITTISRHVEIDAAAVQIGMQHDGRSQRLVADIPLKAASRRRARKAK